MISAELHAPGPVVGRDLRAPIDEVLGDVPTADAGELILLRAVIDLANPMAEVGICGGWAGLEVVRHEVDPGTAVAAVDRPVLPVEQDIVAEVEHPARPDTRVPAGVAGKEVVVERAPLTPPGPPEGVFVAIEGLA